MQELSPFYHFAQNFALYTNRSIFLTGKAGTGKTTFLHNLKNETRKQMAVVAPTGVASINAGGTTIHSFFQLPFTPFVPTAEGRKSLVEKIHMQGHRRKVLQELELLVIDEISMVRADILDAIDTVLRHFRYRHNEPFGGVQLIFIGDMFQLSPVAVEEEWRLLSQYYESPYFFHSQVILQQPPVYIELDKIFRQTNQNFIDVLNEVRNDCLTDKSLALLQSRYNPLFVPPADDTYITLTTHNYKADRINAEELAKLKGKTYYFEAEIRGDYPEKSYPTDKTLELKIGAKVMFIKNDSETPRRYFNGKIGLVDSVEENSIIIQCLDDDEKIELFRDCWKNIRYKTSAKTQQIEEEELGQFIQFPLRLAWAITIHKSQGLTFDKAVIDAGSAFAPGQVYVALSRCRSLEGMVLLSKINPSTIHNDRKIVDYERNKLPAEILERQLEESKSIYRQFILNNFFEFTSTEAHAMLLINETRTHQTTFNDETFPFLENLLQQIQAIREIAVKFQSQLQGVLYNFPVDEEFLQSRIESASNFFSPKLENLLETIRQSPATTDSKTHAKDFTDGLKSLFVNASQKLFLLTGLKHKFTVEDYFALKNSFIVPEFKVNAYAGSATAKAVMNTRHPELFRKLATLRNQICEPENIPIYLVAGTRTLNEMSNFLPQTEKELLQISGFGEAKVEKYGAEFLQVIHDYCLQNNLESLMHERDKPKREKKIKDKKTKDEKIKEAKIPSKHLSLELYQQGKTIEEIAKERNLAVSTIASHLAEFIDNEVDIDEFISEEKRKEAENILEAKTDDNISDYQTLKEKLSPIELNFFMAWRKNLHKST